MNTRVTANPRVTANVGARYHPFTLPFMAPVAFEKENEGGQGDSDPVKDDKSKEAPEDKKVELKDDAAKALEAIETEKKTLLAEVMDRKAKQRQAEAALKELETKLKQFDGIDPEAIRNMLKEKSDGERKELEAKGEFDRVKAMMAEEHTKALELIVKDRDDLKGQNATLQDAINRLTVGNDFGQSTYIRDNLILSPAKARMLYGSHFENQDGKTVAYDKPAGAANRTMLVDGRGEALPFDEALKRIIEADADKESILKAKINPGAGGGTKKVEDDKSDDNKGPVGIGRVLAGLQAQSASK